MQMHAAFWLASALLACAARRDDEETQRLLEPGLQEEEDKSFSFLAPEPQDIKEVEQFCTFLVPEEGDQVKQKLAKDPGSAASLLQHLSGKRRFASDGTDRDSQAFYHLLELHFQNRHATQGTSLPRGLLWQLAEDLRRIQRLQAMSMDELNAVPENEADNFVHYFKGIAPPFQPGLGPLRRAVIFTCSFGDGHRSAQQAVEEILKGANFDVHSVDTTRDPPFEGWMQKELGTNIMDMWYNRLILRWKMYNVENALESARSLLFGPLHPICPSPSCNTPTKDAFRSVLLELRPDIIVTVYHMDLLPILEVAKDVGNVPVLHMATDMDLKMREVFGDRPAIYPRFKLAMPFPQISSQKTSLPLPRDRTFLAGYPVRAAFLQPKDDNLIQEEKTKIAPAGTKVVLVMTGGGGQDVPWPGQLATEGIGVPMHILVIVGRNEVIKTRLEHALNTVIFKGRRVLQGGDPMVTVEVAKTPGRGPNATYVSAERLALLMDLADAIIAKPGGGTTAEIAYRGLPAVFDATQGLLHWEDFTVHTFEDQGCGERFETADELPSVLRGALRKARSTRLVEDPSLPGEVLNPGPRILAEIEQMLVTPCVNCQLFSDTNT